ncbi:hypothetical protein ONV78_17905 [Hahella sp. CR1]|uniref:hypothetical protein n=1 Tax=Hahella sp. CR1 TaxID=2992807 RepID=UPI002441F1EA|nr:hypothetical protein [Hahella sp. CR1]MDG9669616.1 hypothetical protein [Hahella sp. CR1]
MSIQGEEYISSKSLFVTFNNKLLIQEIHNSEKSIFYCNDWFAISYPHFSLYAKFNPSQINQYTNPLLKLGKTIENILSKKIIKPASETAHIDQFMGSIEHTESLLKEVIDIEEARGSLDYEIISELKWAARKNNTVIEALSISDKTLVNSIKKS